MDHETQQLKKRLQELADRSARRQSWTFSEFLNLNEQSVLRTIPPWELAAPYRLWGGYEGAERVVACFGSEDLCGYVQDPPIVCVKAEPLSRKFADPLSHRDVLGALMSLGIRREVTGDILLQDNCAYMLCLESMADYIASQLEQIRHTSVRCTVDAQVPEGVTPEPKGAAFVIASERLDAAVAAVYKLSRGESQKLFTQEKVFINGKCTTRSADMPAPGDVISVRGFGRFIYDGVERETKKGRLRVLVRLYPG